MTQRSAATIEEIRRFLAHTRECAVQMMMNAMCIRRESDEMAVVVADGGLAAVACAFHLAVRLDRWTGCGLAFDRELTTIHHEYGRLLGTRS